MANKRELKKGINYLCGELFAECVAAMHYQKPIPQEDVDNVMANVLHLQDDMLSRVSHPEPGMSAKAYYQDLRDKFGAEVSEIMDQLNS